MSATVDELKIKLEAEAKSAESELDKVIGRVGDLESKIANFGKNGIGLGKAMTNASSVIKKDLASINNSVNKSASEMAESLSNAFNAKFKGNERIAQLRKEFGDLGKDFGENGGFANLKTPANVQRAIENSMVKIAKAYENAEKAGQGTKGFDSQIKNVITYENHIKALEQRFVELSLIEKKDTVPRTIDERRAAIEALRKSVAALSDEELKERNAAQNVRIRGVNDKELAEVESRISRIKDVITNGVEKGRYADYDKMLSYLQEEHKWLQENHNFIETNLPAESGLFNSVSNAIELVNRGIEGVNRAVPKIATNTNDAVERTNSGLDSAARKANFFSETIRRIGLNIRQEFDGGVFKSLKIVVPTEQFTKLQSEIDTTTEKLYKLRDRLNEKSEANPKFTKTGAYKDLQAEIDKTSMHLKDLEAEMDSMGEHTHMPNWEMIGGGIKKSFGESIAIIKKATAAVGQFVGKLGAPITNAVKNITKSISKFSIANLGLVKSLSRTVKMLKLMVLRMALRGVITQAKESFKELIVFSDKTAASFNKIMNAIHYLADTLAALAAPILNASGTFSGLGNILDMVTDKIVDLINKVNQLVSAVLGHGTWIKAIKQTKDYSKELDKAGKKAKKSLQSFDELNNLMSNDDSSGSGDKDVAGDHFKELPIDDRWKNIADWLKKMWERADFTDLGIVLGEKLKNAFEKIPWNKIKTVAKKVGKSLATLLNGFFSVPGLANTIGKTIAEAFNTGLEFALAFVKNFDFKKFGKFVGEFISSSLKNINWDNLKEFAQLLGTGIADAINGLLSTDAISQIGNAIGAVLRSAVDFAYNLLTTIDWSLLGQRIREGINRILDQMGEVDKTGKSGWEKLGVAISDGLKGALTALNEVFGDEETRGRVGEAITEFFNGIDFVGIFTNGQTFIINLAKGVLAAIKAALDSDNFREGLAWITPKLAGFIGAKLVFDGITFVAKGLSKSVSDAIFKELGTELAAKLTSGGLSAQIGSAISKVLEVAGSTAVTTCASIVASIATFFEGAELGKLIGYSIFPDDAELYEGYMGIKGTLNLVKDTYVAIFDDIQMKFGKWVDYQKGSFEKLKDFIATTFTNMVDAVKNSDLYQAIVDLFNDIKDFIKGVIDGARDWGKNIVDNIKQGIKDNPIVVAVEKTKDAVGDAWQKMRSNAGGGIYMNGKWKPITNYATGGMPISGEMFMARENGMPELVGRMGSHTAVANNDQIVASVSDGVYRAVVAAMGSTQNNTNVSIELEGDMARLFRAIRKEGNDYQRRTGNPVFA